MPRPTGIDVVVVTGDRDSYQLVRDPHIKVLYNKRGVSDYVLYDEAGIAERTGGVTPAQYPEYAALRGDTSDNLPGVPGHRREDRGEARHHLRRPRRRSSSTSTSCRRSSARTSASSQDRVFKNREMSLLAPRRRRAASSSTELQQGAFDREKVRVLFDQLEFRTLLPRLLEAVGDVAAEVPEAETLDVEVDDRARRDAALERAARQPTTGDARTRSKPRWAGAPVAARSSGSRSRPTTTRHLHRRRRCSATRRCATALARAGRRRAARRSSRTAPRS